MSSLVGCLVPATPVAKTLKKVSWCKRRKGLKKIAVITTVSWVYDVVLPSEKWFRNKVRYEILMAIIVKWQCSGSFGHDV